MFNALSDQLSVLCIADVSAYQLRHDIVQYLRQHEEIVLNVDFQTEHKMTFEDYLTYMSRDGVWGDDIVLEVAVKIFDRPIFVHESNGNIIKLSLRLPVFRRMQNQLLWDSYQHLELALSITILAYVPGMMNHSTKTVVTLVLQMSITSPVRKPRLLQNLSWLQNHLTSETT